MVTTTWPPGATVAGSNDRLAVGLLLCAAAGRRSKAAIRTAISAANVTLYNYLSLLAFEKLRPHTPTCVAGNNRGPASVPAGPRFVSQAARGP